MLCIRVLFYICLGSEYSKILNRQIFDRVLNILCRDPSKLHGLCNHQLTALIKLSSIFDSAFSPYQISQGAPKFLNVSKFLQMFLKSIYLDIIYQVFNRVLYKFEIFLNLRKASSVVVCVLQSQILAEAANMERCSLI